MNLAKVSVVSARLHRSACVDWCCGLPPSQRRSCIRVCGMGHQHLGELPRTRKWNAIVARITGGSSAQDVAAATAMAAESELNRLGDDPALRHAFWLLARITLAARGEG